MFFAIQLRFLNSFIRAVGVAAGVARAVARVAAATPGHPAAPPQPVAQQTTVPDGSPERLYVKEK